MALKCIFRFENLDSTKDLNQRSEYLFKKGIYYGGKVSIDLANINTIKVSPFRLISHDGMHVLSDSDIILPLVNGEYYIVCKAKYVVDDSPRVSVMAINDSSYSSLNDEEKKDYVVFAHVSSNGTSITEVNIHEYKEEITQIGRNPNRGYFESEQALNEIEAFEGDFATVKSENSSEILLYIFNGVEWISFPNNRIFDVRLTNHKNNKDISIINSLENVDDSKKNKGAYHINWNQLNSLKNLEYENDGIIIDVTQKFYKNDYIQVIPLYYKAIKDDVNDYKVSIISEETWTEVNNVNSLDEGKYFVDYENSLLYVWTLSNGGQEYTIKYFYSYKEKQVISEIEYNKIPRPSEVKALHGNQYSINFTKQAPSDENPYITSSTPVPKRVNGTFTAETINNVSYLTTEETNIFIGDDGDYKKYFEVAELEDGLPIYISDVKVIDNGVVRNINSSDDCTRGWFVKGQYTKLALEISNIGTFTASSLSSNKVVYYHTDGKFGNTVSVAELDYLSNQNREQNLFKAKNITFNTLFNVDDSEEISIKNASLFSVNNNTKIGVLLNSEIGFFYDNNKVGSIGASHDNDESYISIKNKNDQQQTEYSEIYIKNSETLLKSNSNTDYSQVRLLSTEYVSLVNINSLSSNNSSVIISSNNGTYGPFIEIKNDETQSSQFNRSYINLISSRDINHITYRSSITESVSDIELKNEADSCYSRYYSFNNRILLENGEIETSNPDNTNTRKYSNIKIEKDNISINTILGNDTYSKYLSQNDKIIIENGETENEYNINVRRFSNIEIGNNYIILNTRHGTVYNDASINLEDNSILVYSSLFELETTPHDNNDYGIKIGSSGTNKGVLIGTNNFTNYLELNSDEININIEDIGKLQVSEYSINLSLLNSTIIETELHLSHTSLTLGLNSNAKSEYTSSGIKNKVFNDYSKSDVLINTNSVYISTYDSVINENVRTDTIKSAIELNKTRASIYVGEENNDKCLLQIDTDEIVLNYNNGMTSEINPNGENVSTIDLSNSSIDIFNYYKTKIHVLNGSFFELNNTNIVLSKKESNNDNFSSLLLENGNISNIVRLTRINENDVSSYININNIGASNYVNLGIDEIDSSNNITAKIRLLIANSSNSPTAYTSTLNPYVSDRLTVIIGNSTYYIPLILSQP